MSPLPPIHVKAEPKDSCNHWFCCFGCKCFNNEPPVRPMSPPSATDSDSITITTTNEKTTEVVHRHLHKGFKR